MVSFILEIYFMLNSKKSSSLFTELNILFYAGFTAYMCYLLSVGCSCAYRVAYFRLENDCLSLTN